MHTMSPASWMHVSHTNLSNESCSKIITTAYSPSTAFGAGLASEKSSMPRAWSTTESGRYAEATHASARIATSMRAVAMLCESSEYSTGKEHSVASSPRPYAAHSSSYSKCTPRDYITSRRHVHGSPWERHRAAIRTWERKRRRKDWSPRKSCTAATIEKAVV